MKLHFTFSYIMNQAPVIARVIGRCAVTLCVTLLVAERGLLPAGEQSVIAAEGVASTEGGGHATPLRR
jgi:hypothetical protein